MSSHREAPEISKDPVADSTDLYAFVSPDKSGTVTLIANYIPLEEPAGGPNFYEFGGDLLYNIHIDNTGDGEPDITYQFHFETVLTDPGSFLYNTGPITSLTDTNWNSKQMYSVERVDRRGVHVLGRRLLCPPCNIGPLSTPNYESALGASPRCTRWRAGSRSSPASAPSSSTSTWAPSSTWPTCGRSSRPTCSRTQLGLGNMPGVNATNHLNVHSIAIQVPISDLTAKGRPTIGVWTSASRRAVSVRGADSEDGTASGPWRQVSRLGNPLFNEVLVPLGKKDYWNHQPPAHDKQFAAYVAHPELAALFPVIYPAIPPGSAPFANLAALVKSGKPRADLEAILLTGIPPGIVPGFTNFTGPTQADMLRLNTSIPPTPISSAKYSTLGLVGGDPAGFPNGRRIADDVVTIELRAIAGLTYPLVSPSYTVDPVAKALTDGLTGTSVTNGPLGRFPYMGIPYDGYHNPS